MESLTCIKSCRKNKVTFFETNRLVPCLGHRDYSSLFWPVKCPYKAWWHKIFGDIARKLWLQWCFNYFNSRWKKAQTLKKPDNMSYKNCPFLSSNTTHNLFLALKRWAIGTEEWPTLLLPATAILYKLRPNFSGQQTWKNPLVTPDGSSCITVKEKSLRYLQRVINTRFTQEKQQTFCLDQIRGILCGWKVKNYRSYF